MGEEIEPTGYVHYAEHGGSTEAACGEDLTVAGATYRAHADDGVTCLACRASMPAVQ